MFFATEDWFLQSHFTHVLDRAIADGFDVSAAARASGALAPRPGLRQVDTRLNRGARGGIGLARQILAVRAMLLRERPDALHVFGLKPILLALASGAAPKAKVLAIIGRGHLGVAKGLSARLASQALRAVIRAALRSKSTVLAVENTADRDWIEGGRRLPRDQVVIMPGAGVDPGCWTVAAEPRDDIIRVGVAARLVRSKGVHVAVDAVQKLRARGINVELSIAGEPDPDNPAPVSEATLARWRTLDGVVLHGRVADMKTFWSTCHIACVPSLGGEGLPRVLLEAAASGRPVVVTDTPGCADFSRGADVGAVVSPNDSAGLADALRSLIEDGPVRREKGARARALVEKNYTLDHAAEAAADAWRRASSPCVS